jgi:hypothetical protein
MTSADAIAAIVVLAAITLSEGIRRLAADAIVVRRSLLGRWSVARANEIGNGIRLVSPCIPVSVPLVLTPVGTEGVGSPGLRRLRSRFTARAERTHLALITLQVQGMAVLLALVVGIPLAAFRGPRELALVFGVVLSLSVGQACLTAAALMRAGARRSRSLAAACRIVWPFAAFRAAEVVQAQIAAGVPRMAVLHGLLGQDALLRAYRPLVHDIIQAGDASEDAGTLLELVGRPRLEAFLRHRPDGDAACCPRCGVEYEASRERCADCLVPLQSPALR